MNSKIENAVECFRSGFNCSQAIFSTYAEDFSINKIEALRISTCFGAGMGRLQNVCGALTGAFMLIGCKHGRIQQDDTETVEHAYALVDEFSNQFISLHKSILCKELLGCNIRTSEGQKFFKENNLKEAKCVSYVRDTAKIVEELLINDPAEG